jgi:hypothetical protein
MKTTVDISDSLLREAKKYAAEHGITLRELLETGLRNVVSKRGEKRRLFRLKRAPFKGDGMVKDLPWDEMLDLVYEGRGGRP